MLRGYTVHLGYNDISFHAESIVKIRIRMMMKKSNPSGKQV